MDSKKKEKNDNINSDFFVDLPMVFSVVKVDDLVASANQFYGTNIFLPQPGSKFDTSQDKQSFWLYKFTMTKLDSEEMQVKNNVSGFETFLDKIGVFANILEVMNSVDTITIFSNLSEADVYLKAMLRLYDEKIKSVFVCTDSDIGLLN